MSLDSEINELQTRLAELEKMKQQHEDTKKLGVDYNLSIISNILDCKNNKVIKNNYAKQFVCCKFQDIEIIPLIEAILNSLQSINNRLTKLEQP